jgi:8-oxo-dGTP pyrophosphatase MutT (NUDIX family)
MIAFEKSVGAVVFRQNGENTMYLLLKYRSGHWDFPKGHVEVGETEEDTLRREVIEETGISDLLIVPEFRMKKRYFYRAKHEERIERKRDGRFINIFKKVIFFLAETSTKNVKLSHEHLDYRWLCYNDAIKRVTFKNAKDLLNKANEFLKK